MHFSINVARTAEINARDHFYDVDDYSNAPSSSKINSPHTHAIVSKSTKLRTSKIASDSPWSSADDIEISHEASAVGIGGEIEEVVRDPPSEGKGKGRADPIIRVRVISANCKATLSRTSGKREEYGAKPVVQNSNHDSLTHTSEVPSRSRKLLRELRGQGFGMIVVILLGNIAVVVSIRLL